MGQHRSKTDTKLDDARATSTPRDPAEDCASPTTMDSEAAWARDAVTFRLTAERKRALRSLSKHEEEMRSPTAALDLAIEWAIASRALEGDAGQAIHPAHPQTALLVDELRDTVRVLTDAAQDWSEVRAQLARVAADCAELRSAIASASMLADGVAVDGARAPMPLRAWLDGQAGPGTTWLVAKARWVSKRAIDAGMAIWEFEARELGRDGQSPAPRNEVHRVELGPARVDGPLARLERDGGCVISCARSGQGWTLSLRPALNGGKLGEAFAELSI